MHGGSRDRAAGVAFPLPAHPAPPESRRSGPATARPLARVSAGVALATVFGLLYLAVAWWSFFWVGVMVGDAASRTASAMYVVFSRDPHLAAIGFVWLPAPSVVQIPLVLILDVFGAPLFAGNLMTVISAAATVWVLWKILEQCQVPPRIALALTVLYAINPMTLTYAVNGMSESPFVLAILIVIWQFIAHTQTQQLRHLFVAGLGLASATWIRYEAIPFVAAVAIAFALWEVLAQGEQDNPVPRAEARLLVLLSPAGLSLALWLFFNQVIMGDAFHFVNSVYGPVSQAQRLHAQNADNQSEMMAASRSLSLATVYGAKRVLLLSPLFFPITAIATAWALARRDWVLIGVLGMGGSLLVFAVYELGTGGSFGWLRFFIYAQSVTVVVGAVMARELKPLMRRWAYVVLLGAMLIAIPTTARALTTPSIALEESGYARRLFVDPGTVDDEYDVRRASEEMAAYIDALPPERRVYVETFLTYRVAALARHRHRLVITNDHDAAQFLDDPIRRLDYLLVPDGGPGSLDELARRFPGLYEFGAPWLDLEREWRTPAASWRLYRVRKGVGFEDMLPAANAAPRATPAATAKP